MGAPMRILITFVFVATLIPVAISLFLDADTSGWDAQWVTIWDLLPLFAILVILSIVAGWVVMRRRGGSMAFAPVFLVPGVSQALTLYTAEIAVAVGMSIVGVAAIRQIRNRARSELSDPASR
jgi:hypothetical protein